MKYSDRQIHRHRKQIKEWREKEETGAVNRYEVSFRDGRNVLELDSGNKYSIYRLHIPNPKIIP
jgi:hypothetical protein